MHVSVETVKAPNLKNCVKQQMSFSMHEYPGYEGFYSILVMCAYKHHLLSVETTVETGILWYVNSVSRSAASAGASSAVDVIFSWKNNKIR